MNKNDSYDFYKKELLSKSEIGRREKKISSYLKIFFGFLFTNFPYENFLIRAQIISWKHNLIFQL